MSFIGTVKTGNFYDRFKSLVMTGKDLFFILNRQNASLSMFDKSIGCLMIPITYWRHLCGYFEEFYITMFILPTWVYVNGFLKDIVQTRLQNRNTIRSKYLSVKHLVDIVNDIIKANLIIYTMAVLLSYSFTYSFSYHVKSGFNGTVQNFQRMKFNIFVTNTICLFCFGADISQKVLTIQN